MRFCASESAQARSHHIVSKPSSDTKHLTWSHTLREQTVHKKSCLLASHVPCPISRALHGECHERSPHKSTTSQFIDKISDYMNEGHNNSPHSNGSTMKASSSVASTRTTIDPSCHLSETEDTLSLDQQSTRQGLLSSSTIKSGSAKGSSNGTSHLDLDEISINKPNARFPTCYHPISSIGFQCKELKLHLDKSSDSYKIVLGIEYNLNRISMDMLAGKWTGYHTTESRENVAHQALRYKELKTVCKSLKEGRRVLEEESSALKKSALEWKSKQEDFNQAIAVLKAKLVDSMKKTEDYSKALTNSAQLMAELQEENKAIPLLRSMLAKHNDQMKGIVSENEMLKLDVQKMRLERETFKTLLQNKDTEIKKFGDEIKEIQRTAAEQFTKMQAINHEHRLHHHMSSRLRYPTTCSSSEHDGASRSRSRSLPRDRNSLGRDKHSGVWEGGGESAIFPICSSPSSENSNLSLGPSQSWNQISPITSDLNQDRSFEETPRYRRVGWMGDIKEERSMPEQGLCKISEDTLKHLHFLKMDTHSTPEQSSLHHEQSRMKGQVRLEGQSKQKGKNQKQQITPPPNSVPNRPKPFIDLLLPPAELSQWTDSFEDMSFP